jgi:hypothetical protein
VTPYAQASTVSRVAWCLGDREPSSFGKPDLALGNNHKSIRYSVTIGIQETSEDLYLVAAALIRKAQEDDASMGPAIFVDSFAKVLVVGDQNPSFIERFSNKVLVVRSTSLLINRKTPRALGLAATRLP